MTFRKALLVLFFLQHAPYGVAQSSADPHEVQPERPTVATHAGTVAPGWLEIEAGTEFDRYADTSHGGSVPILFKIGLAQRLQLSIQTPLLNPPGTNTTAAGDVSIGIKWRFLEHEKGFGNVAVLPSLKLPSGSTTSGTGTGTTDFSLVLISSQEFGPIEMDLNVGYTRRGGDGSTAPRNATVWTSSFGGPALRKLGWTAEVYGYPGTSGPSGAPPIVAFLGGPTLHLRRPLAFDAGVIEPITGPQPRSLYAGVVYNVGRIWK
jgi:Putative MetA-pathway of phenol degradation